MDSEVTIVIYIGVCSFVFAWVWDRFDIRLRMSLCGATSWCPFEGSHYRFGFGPMNVRQWLPYQ